ncbi:MAG: hypothetical protein WC939_04395 [Acholeplasmataceae bacterium]
MTLAEMNLQFDRKYNQVFDNSAPSINMIEKSMFLTEAAEDIVKAAYDQTEKNEKAREILRNLTVSSKITYKADLNASLAGIRFNLKSKFFELPSEAWFVLSEYINDEIPVIPTPIDEYNRNNKNPFKKPNVNKAWRLDVADTATNKNVREIIYDGDISTYTVRYIKKPLPIILEDLPEISGEQLTINGLSVQTSTNLSSLVHNDIVELAVQKAKLDFEENNISNRVQLK